MAESRNAAPASGVSARTSRSSPAGRKNTKISCWAMTHAAARLGGPAVSSLRFCSATRSRRRRLCSRRHARPPSLWRYCPWAFHPRQRAASFRQLSPQSRACGRTGWNRLSQPFSRHSRTRGRAGPPRACLGRGFGRSSTGPTGGSFPPERSSLGGEGSTLSSQAIAYLGVAARITPLLYRISAVTLWLPLAWTGQTGRPMRRPWTRSPRPKWTSAKPPPSLRTRYPLGGPPPRVDACGRTTFCSTDAGHRARAA